MPSGIFFCNQTHLLMGYQPEKLKITGIGGKAIGDESAIETAFRETVEELLGINPKPKQVKFLISQFPVFKTAINGMYKMFILDFHDLETFLLHCKNKFGSSPYYESFPETLEDLILKRTACKDAEVITLALVPFVHRCVELETCDMDAVLYSNGTS